MTGNELVRNYSMDSALNLNDEGTELLEGDTCKNQAGFDVISVDLGGKGDLFQLFFDRRNFQAAVALGTDKTDRVNKARQFVEGIDHLVEI